MGLVSYVGIYFGIYFFSLYFIPQRFDVLSCRSYFDINDRFSIYLFSGGLPAKAATLITTHNLTKESELLERIAEALFVSNLFERAGFFFEKLDNTGTFAYFSNY